MEKVTYKNREKYAIIARVISGDILLPKKKHCYTCYVIETNKKF